MLGTIGTGVSRVFSSEERASWLLKFGRTGGSYKILHTPSVRISLLTLLLSVLLSWVKTVRTHRRDSQGSSRVKEKTLFLGALYVGFFVVGNIPMREAANGADDAREYVYSI